MTKEDLLAEYKKIREQGETEANKLLSKLRKKARDKAIKNMMKILKSLEDDINQFFVPEYDEENASVQEKYSQRFNKSVLDMLSSIREPENITLKTLERYEENVKELVKDIDEISRKYVKLFDRQFQSRVRALDRTYRRSIKELEKFDKFVKKNYAPTADIESVVWQIDDITDLTTRYYEIIDEINDLESEHMEKSKDIEEQRKKL